MLFSKVKSTHTRRILCRVSGLVFNFFVFYFFFFFFLFIFFFFFFFSSSFYSSSLLFFFLLFFSSSNSSYSSSSSSSSFSFAPLSKKPHQRVISGESKIRLSRSTLGRNLFWIQFSLRCRESCNGSRLFRSRMATCFRLCWSAW